MANRAFEHSSELTCSAGFAVDWTSEAESVSFFWIAVKALKLSNHISETICTTYPHCGNLNEAPSLQPSLRASVGPWQGAHQAIPRSGPLHMSHGPNSF